MRDAGTEAPFARLKRAALERAQPLSASLELTYRCNWRCVFCYNPRPHDRRPLLTEEWLAVLDALRRLGALVVSLTGGDPLVHPAFVEIARAARARALALRVLTNGSLVTEALADELAALRPEAVELSLHGATAAVHDRATATPGSFEAMLRGLDRLRARGVALLLKTPLTRLNEDELDGMISIAESRGVRHLVDVTITPRDDGDLSPLGYRASAAAQERLYLKLAAIGMVPRETRVAGGVNCGLGRITLAVDPEGDVFPCLQWRHRPLGNVRDQPLDDVWRASDTRREAAAVARAANDRLIERGGAVAAFPFCPALALQRTGDAYQPDPDAALRAEIAERARGPAG